ncbi:uncharacterized protein LOC141598927 isoform X1 [Silene latifolia]|uniref:uncharacterized protein LOC141598927 isoform X1 n=1 Tax=Silene latifolia TaxID=37657 RepID=UPI003D783492
MVKFEERFHGKEGVKAGNRDGVSGGKKRYFGVFKLGNRWRARVKNPLLGVRVHLGSYETAEEATLVVQRKKAEFEEMFKGQDSSSMGTCRGYFEGKKLPGGWGVRRQIGRNRVHIRHLNLKNWVSGGSYRACEDAAIVADKKKEEFRETYGGKVYANVPSGVKRTQSGNWVARIKIPESKDRNWFGIFNTLEEAIGSFNKKKAEFDAKQKKPDFDSAECSSVSETSESQMTSENELGYDSPTSLLSAHKEGGEDETSDGDSGVKKHFLGVDKQGNRWRARATNPLLRAVVHLGYYGTPEEAALVAKKKRAEFEKMFKGQDSSSMGTCRGRFEGKKLPGSVRKKKRAKFEEIFMGLDSSSMGACRSHLEGKKFHGKEGVEIETRDGVSGVKVHFHGVDKVGNRWRARARNPLLRARVHLGCYGTPEEAALVVKKKKAEFEEMFKGQDSSSMGPCRGYFKGKKLRGGVGKKKRAEFEEMFEDSDCSSMGTCRGCFEGKKLLGSWGIRRNRVHIRHPKLRNWVSGCSYRACEDATIVADKKREEFQEMFRGKVGKLILMSGDAISSYNKKKAEFDAKQKKSEFDWVEFRSASEANESPMKFGNELGYDQPTSLLSAHMFNNVALNDNSTNDGGVVDIPGRLGDGLVHGSRTSAFDPKNISTASVRDKTFDSEFDRALGLGIIDEYGQLQGKYSEFDTHIWLRPT